MTIISKVSAAIKKPDFVAERLTPLFPTFTGYELTEVNDLPVLKIFLETPTAANLPEKIKIAGQKVRFEYHPSKK